MHWATLLDKIQLAYDSQGVISGVVCDILKAFNCLNRKVIHLLAKKGGLPPQLLTAWDGALTGLRRQIQIGGTLFGNQFASSTGYPEGDPLSVTALFMLVWNIGWTLRENFSDIEFRAYADNLELVGHNTPTLVCAFQALMDLTRISKVEISPDKSWSWANTAHARMFLVRNLQIEGKSIQKSFSEKNLGASMRYSKKRHAKVRHQRWNEGFRRLSCIENLPISREFRSRVIIGGVYPQCLHGVEAELITEKTWYPLRSKVAKALGFRFTRNPFLACTVTTQKILDPLFIAIVNGVRLCRLVAKHAPTYIDHMMHCFESADAKYHGAVAILSQRLKSLGWNFEGDGIWHFRGTKFHVFMSSPKHICYLLERSWMSHVCQKVQHRKYLRNIQSICRMNLKHLKGLSSSQRALVDFQSCGERFTNDAKKYFGEVSPICPFCQNGNDSRLHRFEECCFFEPVRKEFPHLFANWAALPLQAKTYSLWPEPPMFEEFMSLLHCIPFPSLQRLPGNDLHIVFSDGSCKWQKYPDIRISSFAAVEVLENGNSQVFSCGLVPGQQSIYRGEILAGTVAVMRFTRVHIYTDNVAFLRTARKILSCHRRGVPFHLPEEERDIWSLFAMSLTQDSEVTIVKTKAHTDWIKSDNESRRFEGYYNELADTAAKAVISSFSKSFPKYDEMCKAFLNQLSFATLMAKFHARIGEFASLKDVAQEDCSNDTQVKEVVGEAFFISPIQFHLEFPEKTSHSFLRVLAEWFSDMEWFERTSDGASDTSWHELFGCFLFTTRTYPPVQTTQGDLSIEDHVDAIVYTHTYGQGLKTWRRYVGILLKQVPDLLPRKVKSATSLARWKRRGPGVAGRIQQDEQTRRDVDYWMSSTKKLGWPIFADSPQI